MPMVRFNEFVFCRSRLSKLSLRRFVLLTQMKLTTYRRLAFVNSKLTRYNMLASIENLGLIDCNKYYVSFRDFTSCQVCHRSPSADQINCCME